MTRKKETMLPELKELREIKKLLVILLLNSGVKAETISKVLGMTKGNFSKIFPVRNLIDTNRD